MRAQLLKLFEESGLSQTEFAKKAGITPAAFNDFLKERIREFSIEKSTSVAKKLGVNLHWFLTGQGPRIAILPLSEDKIKEIDTHDRLVRKIITTPGATEMLDAYLSLNERDRATVNSLVKQLKG